MDSPHLWAFYLAFLPQFIRPGNPPLARSLLLAGLDIGMGMAWLATLAFAVGRIRPLVESRFRREGAGGAVLIGLGVRLAAARR
jgi:threonine/homoserine/homoserine lactone efflux protein